jgi:plastocyanin
MKNTFRNVVRFIFFSVFSVTLLFAPACKKADDNKPSQSTGSTMSFSEVSMQGGNTFSPSSITVSINTTVKWTNKDSMAHTVTADDGTFDSGTVSAGGTYSHTFTKAGTFGYHCAIHSGMTGTVIVQ